MPTKYKRIAVDLDGVLCEETFSSEKMFAKPDQLAIQTINDLFYSGYEITIYTARPWQDRRMTMEWLDKHNVQRHHLVMAKYPYDLFWDDRTVNNIVELKEKLT